MRRTVVLTAVAACKRTKAVSVNADTGFGRQENAECEGAALYRAVTLSRGSNCRRGILARSHAVFERLFDLLVDELERKTFFEISNHPGLDLAQQHQ